MTQKTHRRPPRNSLDRKGGELNQFYKIYETKPIKPTKLNIPNQIYQTKHNKPKPPNQTYQTRPQYQTKPKLKWELLVELKLSRKQKISTPGSFLYLWQCFCYVGVNLAASFAISLKSFLFLHLCQNLFEGGTQVHHQVGRHHCLHVQVPSQPKGSQ